MLTRRCAAMILLVALVQSACAEEAINLRSPQPLADNCLHALAAVPAGAALDVQSATQTLRGEFLDMREDGIVVLAQGKTLVEIPATDITRILEIRKSHAASYAKRGLLIAAALVVLTSIRSRASASWTTLMLLNVGGVGAGIGAAAGASAHDAVLLCGSP